MKASPSPSGTSSGSGTGSHPASRDASLFGAFSVGISRLVMPISLRAASPENVSTVATCAFHPKRPARSGPSGSSSGCTQCTRPEMPSPSASTGSARAAMSASGMASTMPKAMLEFVTRVAVNVAWSGTCSLQASLTAKSCSRLCDSPGTRWKNPFSSTMPKCVTAAFPHPPRGVEWQDTQLVLLKIGPIPSRAGIGVE